MLYRFTHLSGTKTNNVDTVEAAPITLGRDDLCQIKFDKFKDLAVSAQHAQIVEVTEGNWEIANLSRNGLMVNGVPCDTKARLPNHATIQLGKDGPRVRFDVDQNVGGISRADVMKKQNTKKLAKNAANREKAPTTEERPVFHIPEAESAQPAGSRVLLFVAIGGAILAAVIGAVLFLR